MKFVDIDVETKSKIDLRQVGSAVYAKHPSTELLMISFSVDEEKVYNWNPYTSKDEAPWLLLAFVKMGCLIRAFHSEFEYWIWNEVCTRQFGWPPIHIDKFYDVMAMSCAMAFPASLESSGEATKADIQKDKGGTALINFFSKPSRKKDEVFKNPLDYTDKWNQFIAYCDDDVASQMSIAHKTKLLSPDQYEIFKLTERMNIRGIPIDKKMIEGALSISGQYQSYANKKAKKLIGKKCPFDSLTQTGVVKEWLNENGCDIPNMQKETIADWLGDKKKKIPATCRQILYLRSQAAKTSISKYKKMLNYCTSEEKVHGFIKYHIARTGRWGGRGIQIQNFPRPPETLPKDIDWEKVASLIIDEDFETLEEQYDDVMEVLSGALRASIKAPDGYKFVSADYSQIEARFVMWFAEDENGLAEFGGDGKIYEGMASEIYGIPKHKIGKDSFERFMGKQTILGAGFGMGAPKFVTSCKEKGGIDVELDLAKRAIGGYRKRYPMVPILWKRSEQAAIDAVRFKGSFRSYKKAKYIMRNDHLYCILPSERELCYPYARVKITQGRFGPQIKLFYEGTDPFSKKWIVLDTWGGKVTENFVQAAAADIMANGLLNCERKGYTSLFTVHDEGVSLVKETFGSHKEYEKLMCELPQWAKGCPIKAEGWQGKRYRK